MAKVVIDNLRPGMKTSKPVINNNGMVILGDNTELTAELIDRIRDMNVDGLFIHGDSRPSKPKEDLLEEIDSRFRFLDSEPLMEIIKRAMHTHVEGLYE